MNKNKKSLLIIFIIFLAGYLVYRYNEIYNGYDFEQRMVDYFKKESVIGKIYQPKEFLNSWSDIDSLEIVEEAEYIKGEKLRLLRGKSVAYSFYEAREGIGELSYNQIFFETYGKEFVCYPESHWQLSSISESQNFFYLKPLDCIEK